MGNNIKCINFDHLNGQLQNYQINNWKMKRKRKRKKETSPKEDEKFQESIGRHIVVVGFDNDTINDITIVDYEFFQGLFNKSVLN